VTTAALGRRAPAVSAYDGSRVLEAMLFATAFLITFTKVRIDLGNDTELYVSDVTAALFVAGFLAHRIARRDWVVSRTVAVVSVFMLAFFVVYLIGFYNLETTADRDLFLKGLGKQAVHFAVLICGVAYVERRSPRVYWQTLGCFMAGIAANAVYGFFQLVLAETSGANLDRMILGRLGLYDQTGINVFGSVGGADVYRTTGLTLDPSHLGVMLVIPLLVLFPLYLRLERGHHLRTPLAILLAFLLLVELSTLSRSGLLGLGVGVLVLAFPYRHLIAKPRVLVPLGALALVLVAVVAQRSGFFHTVFEARTTPGGTSAQTHFEFYALIRPALEQHLFFGLGLNTFASYYEFLTGLSNYGPHSYYVALLTETGLVGTALYAAWLVFLFRQLARLRRLGRALARRGDALAARVSPLAWGMTAALLGTMAANVFYLTMQFYYFLLFALLIVAAPVVFGREAARRAERDTVSP
jgi:hypothetical protein